MLGCLFRARAAYCVGSRRTIGHPFDSARTRHVLYVRHQLKTSMWPCTLEPSTRIDAKRIAHFVPNPHSLPRRRFLDWGPDEGCVRASGARIIPSYSARVATPMLLLLSMQPLGGQIRPSWWNIKPMLPFASYFNSPTLSSRTRFEIGILCTNTTTLFVFSLPTQNVNHGG